MGIWSGRGRNAVDGIFSCNVDLTMMDGVSRFLRNWPGTVLKVDQIFSRMPLNLLAVGRNHKRIKCCELEDSCRSAVKCESMSTHAFAHPLCLPIGRSFEMILFAMQTGNTIVVIHLFQSNHMRSLRCGSFQCDVSPLVECESARSPRIFR